jgi:hypothetical protein
VVHSNVKAIVVVIKKLARMLSKTERERERGENKKKMMQKICLLAYS